MEKRKLIVSYSSINTFKRCRQKWKYAYIEKLKPLVPPKARDLGKLIHACISSFYTHGDIETALDEYKKEVRTRPIFNEEVEVLIERAEKAKNIVTRYFYIYGKEDVLETELDFIFSLPTPKGNPSHTKVKGYIDRLQRDEDGRLWLVETKTTSRIPDFDRITLDEQISLYLLGALSLGLNVSGLIFDVVVTRVPSKPKLLKSGRISFAGIITDYYTAVKTIEEEGKDLSDYEEELEKLKKGSYYFKREKIYRNKEHLENIKRELYNTVRDMRNCYRDTSFIYRNPTQDCIWDCSYRDLCIAEITGGDTEAIRESDFIIERSKDGND